MTYIVVSENEIVKAEIERPVMHKHIEVWEQHCLSLPRIPIQGKHNWKVWQEVVEGKDFNTEGQHWTGSAWWPNYHCINGKPKDGSKTRTIAIPIQPTSEQTKSEQGETVFGEWQLCPKCNGQGLIEKPPYLAAEVTEWVSTGTVFTCDVCNGVKILARPLLNINPQTK